MKKISILTQFWGDYVDMYHKYLLKSMMFENNLPRLASEGYKIEWHIYADTEPQYYNPFMIFHQTNYHTMVGTLENFFRENKDNFCMVPCPDLFIGDGSVYRGIKILENKPVDQCLYVAHPRVSLNKVRGLDITAKTNPELVDFAFRHSHKCLKESEDCLDPNLTWAALSWRRIDENNFAVIHNLPTPWILQITESDIEVFKKQDLGIIDRDFIKKLKNENRIRLCGSSDLCFFFEITSDKHSPPLREGLRFNDVPHYEEEGRNYLNSTVVNWRR